MALAKPAVVSNVGVNGDIVDEGINGFLCKTKQDWLHKLTLLLDDQAMVRKFGWAARDKIEQKYSLRKASGEWLVVLRAV